MILDQENAEQSHPCGVSGCSATARYECPRCHLPYCTASCYAAHSRACVDAFSRDADLCLKGVKTSEWERRRFNGIVKKIRDAGFYGGSYEDPVIEDEPQDYDENGPGRDGEEEEREVVGEDELPALMEEFMNSLDDDGKKLIFSMINKGMQERYEERNCEDKEKLSFSAAAGVSARASAHDGSGVNAGNKESKTKAPNATIDDVAEALEDLVQDMETNDLSYEQILARLPEDMARDFETRLRDGRASRLVKLWRPWWILQTEREKPRAAGDHVAKEEEGDMPWLPTSDELLVPVHVPRQKASPSMVFNVIDVLAAYCMSLRLWNGDWSSDSSHVARKIWELSPVLSEDRRYTSIEEVCCRSFQKIAETQKSTGAAIEALDDVSAITAGRSEWVARALFECQRIFEATRREASADGKKHLKARIRKLAYFVSWAMCQDTESFVTASRKVLSYSELERGRCEEVKVAAKVMQRAKATESRHHRGTRLHT